MSLCRIIRKLVSAMYEIVDERLVAAEAGHLRCSQGVIKAATGAPAAPVAAFAPSGLVELVHNHLEQG